MNYALDQYLNDKAVIIKVFEHGILCGLLTGYIKWQTHEVTVYPRKSLVAYWRYEGKKTIRVEDISGLR